MRGLVRMLVMFAPMIIRQFQKYQRNKERSTRNRMPAPPQQRDRSFQNRHRRSEQAAPPPPPPATQSSKKVMDEDERNFKMPEDEFLFENQDLQHNTSDNTIESNNELATNDSKNVDELPNEIQSNKGQVEAINDEVNEPESTFNLKDIFFKKEDEA